MKWYWDYWLFAGCVLAIAMFGVFVAPSPNYSASAETAYYASLRDFTSVEELQGWLDKNGYVFFYAGNSEKSLPKNNDCDDQARRLQSMAATDGYHMSIQMVDDGGYLFGVKVYVKEWTRSWGRHWGNLVIIDNVAYFIDVMQDNVIVRIIDVDEGQ